MDHITANKNDLASVLLGYTINTGWRSQRDIAIVVPYSEWKAFNEMYGYMRVNIHNTNVSTYMMDLATALYNELMYSHTHNKDATLIVPDNGSSVYTFDDYMQFAESLSWDQLKVAHNYVHIWLRNYFRCIDENSIINTDLYLEDLSQWNRIVYRISLSYQLLKEEKLTISWR